MGRDVVEVVVGACGRSSCGVRWVGGDVVVEVVRVVVGGGGELQWSSGVYVDVAVVAVSGAGWGCAAGLDVDVDVDVACVVVDVVGMVDVEEVEESDVEVEHRDCGCCVVVSVRCWVTCQERS